MYRIVWRERIWRGRVHHWTNGLSVYHNVQEAQIQVELFKGIFGFYNDYLIVKA